MDKQLLPGSSSFDPNITRLTNKRYDRKYVRNINGHISAESGNYLNNKVQTNEQMIAVLSFQFDPHTSITKIVNQNHFRE